MIACAPQDGSAVINQILELVKQSAEVKPAEVNRLVDERIGRHEQDIVRVAAETRNVLSATATAMVKAIQQTEAGLDGRVRELIEQLAPRRVEVVTPRQTVKVDGHVRPEFDSILRTVSAGLNVMLVGEAGCGKTTLAEQVSAALGLRFAFLSCTAGVSESRLVGRFVPVGEGGRFEYVAAPFVDFYENGGLFLLDEVDAADANVLMCLNAALANGHMETPNPAKPIIKRHPDFRIIVAANTYGLGADRQYVGRNQLDAATLDRFVCGTFELDYDATFERSVGHADVVRWAHDLRAAVRRNKLRRVVSTRLILNGTKMLAAGFTLADVKRSVLLSWPANERRLIGEE